MSVTAKARTGTGTGSLLEAVARYYEDRLAEHGPTARGVDWNGTESQELRFSKLCGLLPENGEYSLLDYGCGYGGLYDFMKARKGLTRYVGFDISKRMVESARETHRGDRRAEFVSDRNAIPACDFAIASGIFNVRLGFSTEEWSAYLLECLDSINSLARRGYAFNVLSLYSDVEKRKEYLHYADPLQIFDHCKRRHGRYVTLLHDYPLYEFTLLIRKES